MLGTVWLAKQDKSSDKGNVNEWLTFFFNKCFRERVLATGFFPEFDPCVLWLFNVPVATRARSDFLKPATGDNGLAVPSVWWSGIGSSSLE
ncbi:hypothetical protein T265_06331 [Opisthorchis viverrini]|uniref:Uncharacterized protein n=1 Tax=Opisthorchis viverrini TaxID=6198 RepID=A0A074ZKV1_OPIVI|nr:hypothetical protein T265_06331 [Opisthorchis viverrini]KER26412.1 hypothetical protein T265_06331 [Opisthorchis viverrini]